LPRTLGRAAVAVGGALLLFCPVTPPATAAVPPIGIIDLFGLRKISERQVREALGIREGEPVPMETEAARRRLEALPGVTRASISGVCCENGKATLYVGIEEKGAPALQFRAAPRGTVRLPRDLVEAGAAFEKALSEAVQRGASGEDDSQGHALMHDPAARAIQERFVQFAARDRSRLEEVLRHSADASHRALAAEVLAYAADKRSVVPLLVPATRDPAEGVRNNAIRALAIIAKLGQRKPELKLRVPWEPFVAFLNSLVWTDRNKASFALMELSATRDSELFRSLRATAVPSLIEMARWKSRGHAAAAFFLLGRVGGLSEEAIRLAWMRDDRDVVIEAARQRP
jgi:hypothetical protein